MATQYESPEIQELGDRWAKLQKVIDENEVTGKYNSEQIKLLKNLQKGYHEQAEELRKNLGYSGGSDGSQVISIKNGSPSYEGVRGTYPTNSITDSFVGGFIPSSDNTMLFVAFALIGLLLAIRK